MVTETGSFLTPSSALLDNHFHEILETVEEIRGLTVILKSLSDTDEKREEYEGRLYAALTHLEHHVKPAIKEWDRVVDRMPND
jgi:benzoyl-CoA reductase/2-hydroxyglutaryl-CoA dehydratase subunit BcrC/BadD/HgdB